MKRYSKKARYKRYNLRRAWRSLEATIRFRNYKRRHNIDKNLPNFEKRKKLYQSRYSEYKKVIAPKIFSLLKNPEAVLKFINQLRDCYNKQQKVFVILSGVEQLEYDALVVLLSIMVRFKARKILFNGDFPIKSNLNRVLQESGFVPNVLMGMPDEDRYKLGKLNSLHTHAWKNVDSRLGEKIISKASEAIWKEKRRCQGVQRTLIELMQNTNNHATLNMSGERHWWLSVNHLVDQNKVCFSFVDYGIGVFRSLDNKTSSSKFFEWLPKLTAKFSFTSDAELLKLILEGKLHETVTGEYYRGKGLPGIKEALNRNQISNLHIITNKAYANVEGNDFRTLTTAFEGTFIYWELSKSNISCHGYN